MAKNKIGLWTATSLVVGNMVGTGIFLLPAALASFGGISLVGWIVSAVGALLIAYMFSGISKLLPGMDSGPYSYSRRGFGDFIGFLMAWGYTISTWCTNAAIAVAFVGALSTFFPALAVNPLLAVLTGLSAIWLLTWVNTSGIRASGEMQLVTTILKLIPLIAVAFIGIFFIHHSYFIPFNRTGTSSLKAIMDSAAITFFAFLGVECATVPAASIKEPEKTVPRATMLGTGITVLIYVVGTISVMGILTPMALQQSVTPFSDAAAVLWGDKARYWVAGGVAIAAFGALNGWILVQGQIPMTIARDKLFPELFARENKKGAPGLGIIMGSVIVSVIMIMNYTKGLVEQFRFITLLSTLTTLVPYLFVSASYVIIVSEEKRTLNAREWARVLITASLAFIFSLLAIIGAGQEIVFWGFILMLAGTPFYVWNILKRKKKDKTGL